MPPNRSFGFLFAAIFAGTAAWMYFHGALHIPVALAALSVTTAIVAHVSPDVLAPFNKAWFELGQLLGKIVSPVVLGVIFFGIITPVALISKLVGRDPLRLKRRQAVSLWIARTMPNPDPASFKNQF